MYATRCQRLSGGIDAKKTATPAGARVAEKKASSRTIFPACYQERVSTVIGKPIVVGESVLTYT